MQSFKFQFLTEDTEFTLEKMTNLLIAGGYVPEIVHSPATQVRYPETIIINLQKKEEVSSPEVTFEAVLLAQVRKQFFQVFSQKDMVISQIWVSAEIFKKLSREGSYSLPKDASLDYDRVRVDFTSKGHISGLGTLNLIVNL